MAEHIRHQIRDQIPPDGINFDPHASDSRWRHQESSAYAKHNAPRDADERTHARSLREYLDRDRVDMESTPKHEGTAHGGLLVKCGPLLNYRHMTGNTWYGSVLIVVNGGGAAGPFVPELRLRRVRRVEEPMGQQTPAGSNGTNGINGTSGHQTNGTSGDEHARVQGTRLYEDADNAFWRFHINVEMERSEVQWEYYIPGLSFSSTKTDRNSFFVPAQTESMRIMFHSCNGFSVGTDVDAWSGAALWNDVNRVHQQTPFHVMLGGGDQIYNDGIRVEGPLRKWTEEGNPIKRREHKFPEELRKKCDEYYATNYIKWYSTEPFATANGQIPQVNLWDDHDIIDGFGSYVSEFMKCDVFRGIGGVAYKYYMLFQHHLAPPVSTYTSDAPQTMSAGVNGVGVDPVQAKETYVLERDEGHPCYIIGPKPGPYVAEHSRSIYARLGAQVGFFGIDARTERTRHQVNYPETYNVIFDRLNKELSEAASSGTAIQHLIVLLGIPIAYPRLTWLENIFQSPIMGPIKFLNKRFGLGGSLFNHFDGSVDLLDDLDDHYTARTHKAERAELVHRLQDLAASYSVRITILGGDVHLAALGRFYSNPKLEIPITEDHRYMANVISSAIVNKPPPQAVANLLARRNKIHHLDRDTDETLMNFFDENPGGNQKNANFNKVTMPSRNWAMLTMCAGARSNTAMNGGVQGGAQAQHDGADASRTASNADGTYNEKPSQVLGKDANTDKPKDGHSPLQPGEVGAGTKHRAADLSQHGRADDGSLDVMVRVENDQHDSEGKTTAYGMNIPKLSMGEGGPISALRKRDRVAGHLHAPGHGAEGASSVRLPSRGSRTAESSRDTV